MAQIVFLSYHKTGWELTNTLMSAIRRPLHFGGPGDWSRSRSDHWRTCMCDELSCAEDATRRPHKWHAAELAPRPAPLPACYAVVHMVRDPARWALSFYDFHRQQPAPEGWINSVRPDCHGATTHAESAQLIGVDRELLDAAAAACSALVSSRPSYFALLRAHDHDERGGLRAMALLHVLDVNVRGDLLRAAANALTLRRTLAAERVLTLWMDDEVVARPEASFARLAEFLVGVDVPAVATAAAVASALIDAQAAALGSKACASSHVTSSRSPAGRIANLTAGLEADAALAPVYALWRQALEVSAPPADSWLRAGAPQAPRCPSAPPAPPAPPPAPPAPPAPPPQRPPPAPPPAPPAGPPADFPLRVAEGGRHLEDAGGAPFYYVADTQWPLLWAYSLADAAALLDVRRRAGFTAVQLSLIPFGNVPDVAGARAFANASALQPNEAYFARADALLDAVGARGLAAYLVPLWADQVAEARGPYGVAARAAECRAYGRWLGRRWAGRANLLWAIGGDSGLGSRGDEQLRAFRALAAGLREGGAAQLRTFHPPGGRIPSQGFSSADVLGGEAWLDFDSVQVHGEGRQVASRSLASFGAWARPSLVAEGWYYAPAPCMAVQGHPFCVHTDSALGVRRATWAARVGGGSLGDAYGEFPFWAHPPAAGAGLGFSSPALAWQLATVMRRILQSSCWWRLVPDEPPTWAPAMAPAGTGDGGDEAVFAAASAANDTLLLYFPSNTLSVSVDLALFAEAPSGVWHDPASGRTTAASIETAANASASPARAGSLPNASWVLLSPVQAGAGAFDDADAVLVLRTAAAEKNCVVAPPARPLPPLSPSTSPPRPRPGLLVELLVAAAVGNSCLVLACLHARRRSLCRAGRRGRHRQLASDHGGSAATAATEPAACARLEEEEGWTEISDAPPQLYDL